MAGSGRRRKPAILMRNFFTRDVPPSLIGRDGPWGWWESCIRSANRPLSSRGPLYLFELDWQDLEGCTPEKISFQAIPSVPWVHRDIAVVVDESVHAEEVRAIIQAEDEEMVRNVLIFDVYSGDQISSGKKSLAFSYQIGSLERTLTDAEVEALQDKIIKSLKKKLQAEVR